MTRTHDTSPTARGGERRQALLIALEELLAERPLPEIGIAHIAQRAGVARSGFYFYFPTKGAAVAALLEGLFDETIAVGAAWLARRDAEPAARIAAGIVATVGLWERHARPLAAMLDASSDPEIQRLWQTWMDAFVATVGTRIADEQRAGLALPGDANGLAALLLGMNLNALERHVQALVATGSGTAGLAEQLSLIWTRSLYGTAPR